MKCRVLFIGGLLLWLIMLPKITLSQVRTWEFIGSGSVVTNLKTPLEIYQNDEPEIEINGKYKSEPLEGPIYYDMRITTWHQNRGWALKFTHHKIILQNRPTEIQRFSITDGFNLITINRLWQKNRFSYSVGGGVVVTIPESTIWNLAFPEDGGIFHKGYFLSGPTVEAALAKYFVLTPNWIISAEARATASYVRVPVQNGHANVTNVALHFLTGFGYRFKPK